MNWREIFEQRLERDPQYRYRVDRFRDLRKQATELGQKLEFKLLHTGILNIYVVETVEKKLFGFTYKKETKTHPVAEGCPYLDAI
jgi:hypothetical protein